VKFEKECKEFIKQIEEYRKSKASLKQKLDSHRAAEKEADQLKPDDVSRIDD